MKILVVDNMLVPFSPTSVPGGTERRTISDAVAFAGQGHTVSFTVAMPKGVHSSNRVHNGVQLWRLHDKGKEEEGVARGEWQKTVTSRLRKYLEKNGLPDVVHYGCNSHFWMAKMLMKEYGLPLNCQVGNYLSGNDLFDVGRLRDLYELKSLGAHFTFNTQTCSDLFHVQIDKLRDKGKLSGIRFPTDLPLTDHINSNNAGVGFVGNPAEGEIKPDRGYAVVAARADPVKRIGSFAWVDFPLVVFLKYRASTDKGGFFEKLLSKLKSNPNIKVFVDAPYDKIMRGFSGARLCLVSWPDETFGLTAFESISFGVPAVVFKRNPEDPNATEEFLTEVTTPPILSYSDKEWKSKLRALMKSEQSVSERRKLAAACRERYSYSAYVQERLRSLKRAIKKRKSV